VIRRGGPYCWAGPVLIRNYDWEYRLFDATMARTAYGGRRVLGVLDCLYAARFGADFGTLYTAEYRPAEGVGRYRWPGQTWAHSLDQLGHDSIQV